MPQSRSAEETQQFLKTARERFQQGQEAIQKQRQRELADLAFYAGGEHQWDPETLKARQAQQATAGLPPVPARPSLTINKVREPVHQVLNAERQSDMSIELVAADDFEGLVGPIAETEIELREGLVRRIQRESEAADARSWAFARATIAGVGYYGVKTRYLKGKTFDQEVYIERFYNQAAITLDPAHEQPDGSDAEWGFEGSDVPWDRYIAEFPRRSDGSANALARADDSTFRALGEEFPGWFSGEETTKAARVVNYWYTERETRTLCELVTGELAFKDELPSDFPDDQIANSRPVVERSIKWAKIDATQVLEETDWPGPDLPIVKVLGEELQPFDGERRAEGMVRPARDAQQGFNAMVSKWVEQVGLAPIPPFQVAEGQVDDYKAWYQAANTRTLPYLPYRTKDLEGNTVGPPTRTNVDTPIQAIAASVQMFDEAIKSTTLVPAVQLGQATDARLKSGRAISLLQQQAEVGTSNYLDNLRRSIRYEGQILNNLLYPIYGKPGRLVRILTGEGESETVRIAGPVGNGGLPGMTPGVSPQATQTAKQYRLTEHANFNVIVKVTRSFDSRRQEEATTIGEMLQTNPTLMTWFGDLFFKNQDGPGHEEMADRAKVMLDPKIQAYLQQHQQGMNVPPQMLAQMSQLQARLQQAEQILQQAQQELRGREAEQRWKYQIAQEDRAWEREKLERELAADLAKAHIAAAGKQVSDIRADQEEAIALDLQHQHEHAQAELDRAHAAQMADQHAQAAAAQSAQQHQQGLEAQEAQAAQPPTQPA